jgi:hypothetical protein
MLLSIREFWDQAMAIREARWIMAAAGLLVVLLVGFYLFKLVRDMALGNTSFGSAESTDFLTEFQKLRDEGKVNDEEYKRLKQSIPNAHSGDKDSTPIKDSVSNEQIEFLPDLEPDDKSNES